MMIALRNDDLQIEFGSEDGRVTSLRQLSSGREYLVDEGPNRGSPFEIWYDFHTEYTFARDWRGTPEIAPDPAKIATGLFVPCKDTFVEAKQSTDNMTLVWRNEQTGLMAQVEIRLVEDTSIWQLSIHNDGSRAVEMLPIFPSWDGIGFGPGSVPLMAFCDQGGYIVPLWSCNGGVYGNGKQASMQWGCFFDRVTADCFGYLIRDDKLANKDIRLTKPTIQVRWFPPRTIAPNESITIPETDLILYRGSWRRTAEAYGDWFRRSVGVRAMPSWLRKLDSYYGAWTEKRGNEYRPRIEGSIPMASFAELPQHFYHNPLDVIEFAFFCRGSQYETQYPNMLRRTHTDGMNRIREDLGGSEALRQGIERVHQMGHFVTLYVEGYIVPEESELFKELPDAYNWVCQDSDGQKIGNYSSQHFLHMCPGCRQWQDHLASMCARLIRETDADGIRLDSLGFYYIPCYHPMHLHDSPFDYNRWVLEMLSKVRIAVDEVKPECLLATEAAVDYYIKDFTSAFTSQGFGPDFLACFYDIAPMHVAFPEYNLFLINGGPVAASLMGLPSVNMPWTQGSWFAEMQANWLGARYAVAGLFLDRHNDLMQPMSSRTDMALRRWSSEEVDVVLGARVDDRVIPSVYREQVEKGNIPSSIGSCHNDEVFLARGRAKTSVTVPRCSKPASAWLYDIEMNRVRELPVEATGQDTQFSVDANWFMVLLDHGSGRIPIWITTCGVEGKELKLALAAPNGSASGFISAPALGLHGISAMLPAEMSIDLACAPEPGVYRITVEGKDVFPTRRFVEVR